MKKLFISFATAALLFGYTANAQDEPAAAEEEEEAAGLEFAGSVDTYYRTTLNTDDNGPSSAPGTSFANGTGFNIGMINLIASQEGDKAGFVADLVFGPRGDDAVFGSYLPGNNDGIVNQLYAYWNMSDNLTFTIGNFNTFLGYEVISPASNFNYSTSYMFSYGPFSHTGAKLDYAISDNLSAMVAVMNPTDATTGTFVNTQTLGFQLGYSNDQGGAWLNILAGDQDGTLDVDADTNGTTSNASTFQIDLTTGWDVSDELYVGFNTTFNTTAVGTVLDTTGGASIEDVDVDASTFLGAALYLQYALSDDLSIGVRGEYFAESNGGAGAIGAYDTDGAANVIDLTLSANYTVGGFTLIPEFRVDLASEDTTFIDKDGNGTTSLASFLVAGVYAF